MIITIVVAIILFFILAYAIRVEQSWSGFTSICIAIGVEIKHIVKFVKGEKEYTNINDNEN